MIAGYPIHHLPIHFLNSGAVSLLTNTTIGALWGFLAGAGWVATFVGTHYLFERKSFRLFLINAGFSIVALTAMSVIIAAWK